MKMFDGIVIIRWPCLMEDEGNFHPVFVGHTWDEINEFIEWFTRDEYFGPHNLVFIGGLSTPGVNKYKIKRLRDFLRDKADAQSNS
jgi:hypothetical protein